MIKVPLLPKGPHWKNPVFIDVETNGTDPDKHQIIEIGACCEYLPDFERKLFFRLADSDPVALETCNFKKKKWKKEAVKQKQGFNEFADWIFKAKSLEKQSKRTGNWYKVAILCGYKIDTFDFGFIKAWFDRFDEFMPIEFRTLDVYQLALWARPGLESYKLVDVAKVCGCELNGASGGAHSALWDAKQTRLLAAHLLSSINAELPDWAADALIPF